MYHFWLDQIIEIFAAKLWISDNIASGYVVFKQKRYVDFFNVVAASARNSSQAFSSHIFLNRKAY